MTVVDEDLRRRVRALLEPGEIELAGMIVHTDLGSDDEIELHQETLAVGDAIAAHVTDEDWYVYSGNDDSRFSSNQHQGLTIVGDEFVWECQQLLREGTFDVVIYYPAHVDQEALLEDVRELGHDVTGVETE